MSDTTKYIQEFSSGLFPRWYAMVGVIVGWVATAIPIIVGLFNAKVAWYWIALFVVALLLFILCSFLLFRRVAIERDGYKWRQGTMFYSRRPGMKPIEDFINKYDKVWAVYGTGESMETNKAYDVNRFERLILLDPDGKHLEVLPKGYHLNDQKQMRDKINSVTDYIHKTVKEQEGVTKVRWFDGCTPFSLTLGNPHSGNGGIFLEVYVPYEAGHKRPSFVFTQKDQPELFSVLLHSYEQLWKASGGDK